MTSSFARHPPLEMHQSGNNLSLRSAILLSLRKGRNPFGRRWLVRIHQSYTTVKFGKLAHTLLAIHTEISPLGFTVQRQTPEKHTSVLYRIRRSDDSTRRHIGADIRRAVCNTKFAQRKETVASSSSLSLSLQLVRYSFVCCAHGTTFIIVLRCGECCMMDDAITFLTYIRPIPQFSESEYKELPSRRTRCRQR